MYGFRLAAEHESCRRRRRTKDEEFMAFSPRHFATAGVLALALVMPASAKALDDRQKEEIGAFIKQYLIENPEILLEVQDALEAKQQAARQQQAAMAVAQNESQIFASADDIVLGNPKGDVTIVEFFDYNCGYCRHALADMETILKADQNVRFVLKEFPILGAESVAAHKVSDAFRRIAPEKAGAFHRAMLGSKGRATQDSALDVAESLGVDAERILKEMKDSPNDAQVQETYRLAQSLGITGTPSYIVGNEAVFGAIGSATIEKKVANVRSCGKASC